MPSKHETFWELNNYAVVGHSKKRKFPVITYRGLKKMGKTVYPVDTSIDQVDGDKTYSDLKDIEGKIDAVVLEVPKEETLEWVEKAVKAGVKDLWMHMLTDTPEAVDLARENGIKVRRGTCAAMYVTPGVSYHSIHKFINKMLGKY
ncbi:CoA-binding protein [Spirochaetota bacterium]